MTDRSTDRSTGHTTGGNTAQPLPPDWLDKVRGRFAETWVDPAAEAVGRATRAADGIAGISGLPDAALGALLRRNGGQHGFARALDRSARDAVMLDGVAEVAAGLQWSRHSRA